MDSRSHRHYLVILAIHRKGAGTTSTTALCKVIYNGQIRVKSTLMLWRYSSGTQDSGGKTQ